MKKTFLEGWSKVEKTTLGIILTLGILFFFIPLVLLPFRKNSTIPSQLAQNQTIISLGTVRVNFEQKPKRIVVLSLSVIITESEKEFLDEISVKKNRLKTAAESYIQQIAGSGTQQELAPLLSQGLLDTLNSMVYLGKISDVLIENFEIIE
ncbi:MAG TPA: hypothetical protein P5519_02855 [Spirochaetia bacterium]|nr:hypothetical protein [Spirochaetales bacterium]HRS64810.1 hypothetical protein [Spirochaetia bacterium]HOT59310.1 hypothetical protein [Spirochaetales bacterium]HPD79475.1 hypothetical protein [Spirochaetales bacterium]HQK33116.1 hypothetical protein [Spirochaetales bacterium]